MTDKQLDNNIKYIDSLNKKLATIAKTKGLAEKVDMHRIIKQITQLTQVLRLHTFIITD